MTTTPDSEQKLTAVAFDEIVARPSPKVRRSGVATRSAIRCPYCRHGCRGEPSPGRNRPVVLDRGRVGHNGPIPAPKFGEVTGRWTTRIHYPLDNDELLAQLVNEVSAASAPSLGLSRSAQTARAVGAGTGPRWWIPNAVAARLGNAAASSK